uniref:Hint domain-containing protein n=1 Tax=Panagrolaimus davidi TaxID=227884 RepID=A0A914PQ98_9BILA
MCFKKSHCTSFRKCTISFLVKKKYLRLLKLQWQQQGTARGISSASGIVTEILTCNNQGQLVLTETNYSGIVDQVECTSADVLPPLTNFQAPPQLIQQPFQPVQFIPQQQPIQFQPAPAYYPVAGGSSFNPSLAYLCFSSDTFVTTIGKIKKRMDEIKIGEWILSGDSKSGEIGYTKVISWIHKKPNLMAEFLKITLENGQELKITKKHYIYKGICKNETSPLSITNNNIQKVYAENVTINECVFTVTPENQLIEKVINKIEIIQEKGIYAPLTETGNIIVNDILASCYSNINSNSMQHSISPFYEILKNILSSFGFHHFLSLSTLSQNEFDLIPGFNYIITILKDIIPYKY